MIALSEPALRRKIAIFAAVWLVAFFVAFFCFDLPNSNPTVSRWTVVTNLPFLYLELVDPLDEDVGENSGWRYFPQRLYPLGVALFMLTGAAGLGGLLLRAITSRDRLSAGEFLFFSIAAGLSASSLLVLFCGLAGFLSPGFIGGLLGLCFIVSTIVESTKPDGWIRGLIAGFRERRMARADGKEIPYGTIIKIACGIACLPFVLSMLLGAALPSTDFDVKAYHLEGAKEFFLLGEITFLPHNVYTSFPFLTEMLLLEGMVLTGDWWWGALVGKLLLMSFGPLTGFGVFLAARRWWGATAGWLALLIHLSTPWTYRISIIAYAEGGLTFYLFAAAFAALLIHQRLQVDKDNGSPSIGGDCLLAGIFAGSAMACKYPGLVSVIIPVAGFIKAMMFLDSRHRGERFLSRKPFLNSAMLGLGIVLAVGPWLAKNLVETGNPVYPLLYSVFGGVDWTVEMNQKWIDGHDPDTYAVTDLAEKFVDVTLKSDWLSPLLFGLAPLAFLVRKNRALIGWLWIYVAYLFATWWLLTHRIDRFWVPLIPIVSLLAGVGLMWTNHKYWTRTATVGVVFATIYNLGFITTGLCGYNAYLLDYTVARISAANITSPEIVLLNRLDIPPGKKVLSIGDAEVFDAEFPIIYHSVFDKPILDEWWGMPQPDLPPNEWPQRDAEEIHAELLERDIAYVYVNWSEILRYRTTYRYCPANVERFGDKRAGYTEYVVPERFRMLQRAGVLGQNLPQGQAFAEFDRLSDDQQKEIERWAPELIVTIDGKRYFVASEILPVRSEAF